MLSWLRVQGAPGPSASQGSFRYTLSDSLSYRLRLGCNSAHLDRCGGFLFHTTRFHAIALSDRENGTTISFFCFLFLSGGPLKNKNRNRGTLSIEHCQPPKVCYYVSGNP